LAILSLLALWIFYRLFIKLKKSRNEIDIQNKILAKREEEKSLLLKELHHRVKNNLQIVSSLLYLQSIAAKDHSAKNAFKEGQNRVDAMAMIHKYLYTSEELTQVNIHKYLSRLVESIAYSYNFTPKNIDLKFNIAQEPLDVDIAIPLGLIANELVSNAFKHAFVEVERPKLSINLRMDGNLVLEVADNGAGMPKDVNYENTFGMELIQSLEKQLGAKLEYHFQKGALFRLIVPKEKLRKLP
jgi:two-component sensor histidine kinase